MPATESPTRAGRSEWIGLAVLLLAVLLVSMDVTVLSFAAPYISADLAPSGTQQLWMLDVYGFVLAGLLIPMGSLADLTGRRRLLTFGAAAFGLASIGAAFAQSAEQLIACRALMGIGGATLMPSSLALLRTLFADAAQRRTAVAVWTTGVSGGAALGPLFGGLLLQRFSWGSVFLINVPVMVALVVAAPLLLPESRDRGAARFDLPSAVLALGAMLPAVYGLQRIAVNGLDPWPIAALVTGLLVGTAFLRRQGTLAHPMIDLALLRDRTFGGALGANLMAMLGLVGFAVFTTQYLQSVLGQRPLTAALWTLPAPLSVGIVAPLALRAARRVRPGFVVGAGFLVALAGFAVLTRTPVHHGLPTLLVGAVATTMGLAAVMTLITDIVIVAAPAARTGSAAALAETGQELGGALGVAVLGSLGTAVYRHDVAGALPGGVPHAAHETLGGALESARGLPTATADTLLSAARTAFVHGLHTAALGAMVVMALAAVVSAIALRAVPPQADDPSEEDDAHADYPRVPMVA